MRKVTLRNLLANKLRLGLATLAVVLGVAFVSGAMTFSASLDAAVAGLLAESGAGTDTVVRAKKAFADELGDATPPRAVPGSLAETIAALDGVAKVHGSVSGFAAVVGRDGRPAGSPPRLGVDWTEDADFSIMHLTSGRGPRTAGEVAVDAATAEAAGYRTGDRVSVALRGGSRTFTLTGVFEYGRSGAAAGQLSVVAFEPRTAGRLLMERPGTYAQVAVRAADGVSQERLRDAVAAVVPRGFEAVTGRQAIDEQAASIKDLLSILRTFLLVFAGIAVFVGSFIIVNTFSMLVARRRREMALLRAVGASRTQVTRAVLGEAAAVGLAGATLGLVLGGALATGLSLLMLAVLGQRLPIPGWPPPASAVLWSYAVGLAVTTAAAYLPARRAGKIPPVAALRDGVALPARALRARLIAGTTAAAAGAGSLIAGLAGPESGDTDLYLAGLGAVLTFFGVAALSPVISRPLTRVLGWPFARFRGAAGRLGRANAQRDPRRTAATASALMVGLALVGTVTVVTGSMSASVHRQIDTGIVADYRIEAPNQVPMSSRVLAAVAATPGVRRAVASRTGRVRVAGTVRAYTAGEPGELVRLHRLRIEAGGAAPARDELLISRGIAAANGWRVGSALPGEYQDGARTTFRVAGIYADVPTLLGTTPTMILSTATHRAHSASDLIDRIDVSGAASRRALQAALRPWPDVELRDKAELKQAAGGDIDTLLSLVLVLLVLSVVIAGLGIVNTLALSVVERTREIGLLRAVGMQRRQLRRMIRYEAVVISVFGAVLGLGTGVIFGAAIQRAMAGDGMEVLAIPAGRLGLYALAAALLGVVAAAWPARRAARTDILRAIAAE
jgi:ABC-type antimicrobial peptide transport system permease subunit